MARPDWRDNAAMTKGDEPIELLASTVWDDDADVDADVDVDNDAEVDDDTDVDVGRDIGRHEPSRPRWVVPALATVLALAVAGIVVSVSSGNDAAQSPVVTQSTAVGEANTPTLPALPTSPTLPSSPTAAVPTLPEFPPPLFPAYPTTTDNALVPKYVIDVPPQFNVLSAVANGAVRYGFTDSNGLVGEFWAQPEATARSGRWLHLRRQPGLPADMTATSDSYRRSVGEADAVITPPTVNRPTTLITIDSGGALTQIETFGFTTADLDSLVAAIATGQAYFEAFATTAGMRQLLDPDDLPFDEDGIRSPLRVVSMVGPSPPDATGVEISTIDLFVDTPNSTDRRLQAFLLTDIQRLTVGDDSAAIAGNLAASPGRASVTWLDRNGLELVLFGSLPVDQLISLANTVRVDDDLWDLYSVRASPRSPINIDTDTQVVITTVTAQAVPWTVGATTARDTVSGRLWLTWSLESPRNVTRGQYIDAAQPRVSTLVYRNATFVFASAPAASLATTLRLSIAGAVPREIPLTISPTRFVDLLTAATAFDEISEYTASILDASGNVLATWPATAAD